MFTYYCRVVSICEMKRALYIIPGYGESTKNKAYQEIRKIAMTKSYRVFGINIDWKRTGIIDWQNEALRIMANKYEAGGVILGFSFGAMVSLYLAREFSFHKVYLCSLSPYFAEDLDLIPASSRKFFGTRRIQQFSRNSFRTPQECSASFMVGSEEWPVAIDLIKKRYKQWPGRKKILVIPGADHDISDARYLRAIARSL